MLLIPHESTAAGGLVAATMGGVQGLEPPPSLECSADKRTGTPASQFRYRHNQFSIPFTRTPASKEPIVPKIKRRFNIS
jgi:hypothetical protein